MNRVGWLIERDGKWWGATYTKWEVDQALNPGLWRANWSSDPHRAVCFARKADAEAMIRYWGLQHASATEHLWVDTALSAPEREAVG